MASTISSDDDVFDSRNVIERIEELEAMIEDGNDLNEDDANELAALRAFAEEAHEVSDWKYGETFIRDSYFQSYAMDFAEDCGYIQPDLSWPYDCIDWERAARELRMDYTAYTFDGVTYWARA